MNIIRAEYLGMCFGVRDAITLAQSRAKEQPLTILGELVHNESVLDDLQRQGISIQTDPAKVRTSVAMITAHGASKQSIARAREHGFELFEGTCPLVHHAHNAVRHLVAEGYHPIIIGKRDHVEVRGLTEDLADFDIIESEGDVRQLHPRTKFGVASQTTQPINRVLDLVAAIRSQFPASEVQFTDTVCQPTKQRQRAAIQLSSQCNLVVVIGGENSNNTKELVNTCRKTCARVYHVCKPDDLQPEWFADATRVGITAGTSTPDYLIDAVEARVRSFA